MTASAMVPLSERVEGNTLAGRVSASTAGEFTDLPLSSLRESKTNPRRTFDKKALEELAQSIRDKGVLMPILARPITGKAFEFEVIAGARRFRAAELAGLATIPARVVELDDKAALEVQVIENLQRADVHPLEEAEGYEALHKKHGYAIDDLAAKVGKSKAYIYARLKYLALGAVGRKAFLADELNPSTALLVARIPVADLQALAVKAIVGKGQYDEPMSFRRAVDYVQRTFMLRLDEAGFSTTSVDLVPAAGSCVACPKRTGNQRELFDDVKSADVCTDPVCFRSKRDAAFLLRATEAEAKGLKVIPAREAKKMFAEYGGDRLDYKTEQKFVSLDSRCYEDPKGRDYRTLLGTAAAEHVTLVQGPERGAIVELVPKGVASKLLKDAGVVKAARAEASAARSSRGAQDKYRQQDLARKKKAEAETVYRNELVRRVVAKVPGVPGAYELRAIASEFVRDVDEVETLAAITGWEIPKSAGYNAVEAFINRQIEKATTEQLVRLLMAQVLLPDAHVNSWGPPRPPKGLLAAAKHYGVNPEKVRSELAAADKAKAAPAGKKAAAAKPAPAKGPLARKGGRK
jgi:ParB/RepB/Spo0J family partition protein